jgi:hypothetical protein
MKDNRKERKLLTMTNDNGEIYQVVNYMKEETIEFSILKIVQ